MCVLQKIMLEMDSLPPMSFDTPNAISERNLAKQVLEYAVILAVNIADKDLFSRHMSCLRPYYTNVK